MVSQKAEGISIVICVYNGSKRLPQTLKHLSAQKVDPEVKWEVVIVDNASTDNTSDVAKNAWEDLGTIAPLSVFYYSIPGKTGALQLGFLKARYKYLLICDDDNWLNDKYVQLAFEIMSANPNIGALGGLSQPAFELECPAWLEMAGNAYATGSQHKKNGTLENDWEVLWGAGMVLRWEAIDKLHSSGFKYLLTTKRGKSILSGEDDEVCYALKLINYKIVYESSLQLHHFIPQHRLEKSYLKRLMFGSATAIIACEPYQAVLAYKKNSNYTPQSFTARRSLFQLIKFLLRENISFFSKYFHPNLWKRINYQSSVFVMWLRVRHARQMKKNYISIKSWFDNSLRG